MESELADLRRFVDEIGAFSIRERSMRAAQEQFRRALAVAEIEGRPVDVDALQKFRSAVKNYFRGFHKDASKQLQDIDRRLEHLAQLQFNAVAERGVAAKRVELTASVLDRVDRL